MQCRSSTPRGRHGQPRTHGHSNDRHATNDPFALSFRRDGRGRFLALEAADEAGLSGAAGPVAATHRAITTDDRLGVRAWNHLTGSAVMAFPFRKFTHMARPRLRSALGLEKDPQSRRRYLAK
jgi:hypothetical protein